MCHMLFINVQKEIITKSVYHGLHVDQTQNFIPHITVSKHYKNEQQTTPLNGCIQSEIIGLSIWSKNISLESSIYQQDYNLFI